MFHPVITKPLEGRGIELNKFRVKDQTAVSYLQLQLLVAVQRDRPCFNRVYLLWDGFFFVATAQKGFKHVCHDHSSYGIPDIVTEILSQGTKFCLKDCSGRNIK